MKKILLAILVTAGVVGQAQVPASPAPAAAPDNAIVIEQILVKVNGEIITQSDLESRQVNAIRQMGAQPTTNAELAQLINQVTPDVVRTAVDETLMVQKGKELGYQLSDEQFEEVLDNLRAENDFADNVELAAALAESEGLTMTDLRRVMESQMLVSQVQQVEILNKVRMTDTEAREYYDQNMDEFTIPASATLREILVAVAAGGGRINAAAEESARTVAETTVARLRAGEDFATVAAEVSDSPSKANGGLIGPLLVSEYSEGIQELIAALEVGEVSDPVRTGQGYQLVMLAEHSDAEARPFEEVRENISNNVFNDRRTEEYANYLRTLRDEAIMDWKSDDLRLIYESEVAAADIPITTSTAR
jgi:peptidyl-prolyl cis-trans isomerase SurA